jgi:hypothetical protein
MAGGGLGGEKCELGARLVRLGGCGFKELKSRVVAWGGVKQEEEDGAERRHGVGCLVRLNVFCASGWHYTGLTKVCQWKSRVYGDRLVRRGFVQEGCRKENGLCGLGGFGQRGVEGRAFKGGR